ncbi:MAG TPA: HXXEE domain-containing protein [Gemmatimonadaceae bacterium]|nr:HXXEE domain-containing protein [Gemmatimonadaceae bacterium]
MGEELRSILIGTAGLSVAAVIALFLTLARGTIVASEPALAAAARLAVAAVVVQAAHFAEEAATGFHQRFPELLGVVPWSLRFFVLFNLVWLVVWVLSIWGMMVRQRGALFPLWFLGLACIANGLAHPLLAIRAGGYFPGLATAPLVGILGVMLFRRLLRITDAGASPLSAA